MSVIGHKRGAVGVPKRNCQGQLKIPQSLSVTEWGRVHDKLATVQLHLLRNPCTQQPATGLHLNPVHALSSCFFKIHFNIVLPYTPRNSKHYGSFPLLLQLRCTIFLFALCLCKQCHESFEFHKVMELPEHLGSCMFRISGRPSVRLPSLNKCDLKTSRVMADYVLQYIFDEHTPLNIQTHQFPEMQNYC